MRTAGADLLVPADLAEAHLLHSTSVVCLTKRPGIDQVAPRSCGATATLAAIAGPSLPTALREAAGSVAYPAVQNRATVGGNVAAGRPGCVAVALLALRAAAWVLDASGERSCVPVAAVVGENVRPILGFEWSAYESSGFGKERAAPGGGSTLGSVAISLSDHRPGEVNVAVGAEAHAPRVLRRVQDAVAATRRAGRSVLERAVRADLRTDSESYLSYLLARLVDRLVRRLMSRREV